VTNALVELARAYVETKGALRIPAHLVNDNDGMYCRDIHGAVWMNAVEYGAIEAEWLPDLTDAATGGVMLVHHDITNCGLMGPSNCPQYAVWGDATGWHYGASYGEAVAKAHVAKAAKGRA
jgi:hypothetical protein